MKSIRVSSHLISSHLIIGGIFNNQPYSIFAGWLTTRQFIHPFMYICIYVQTTNPKFFVIIDMHTHTLSSFFSASPSLLSSLLASQAGIIHADLPFLSIPFPATFPTRHTTPHHTTPQAKRTYTSRFTSTTPRGRRTRQGGIHSILDHKTSGQAWRQVGGQAANNHSISIPFPCSHFDFVTFHSSGACRHRQIPSIHPSIQTPITFVTPINSTESHASERKSPTVPSK